MSIFLGVSIILYQFCRDRTVQPLAHLYYYTHTWGIYCIASAWNQFLAKQGAMKWDGVRAIILPSLMDDP